MLSITLVVGFQSIICTCTGHALVNGNRMEKMKQHEHFVRKLAPQPSTMHELVFAVKQQNLDTIGNELIMRTTPNSSTYMKWLSFEQVGNMTSNPVGAKRIVDFLKKSRINITSISAHQTYIHATAPVSTWEFLLQTKFYIYDNKNHNNRSKSTKSYIRTHRYYVPKEITEHATHIFNTVQLPPLMTSHKGGFRKLKPSKKQRRGTSAVLQDTTISSINSLYSITSNEGSSTLTQSVFETNEQYYSPDDVLMFQQSYGHSIQAAVPFGGYTTSTCSIQSGSGNDCFEANLDVQYIMGISQSTITKVWHVDAYMQDPFLAWILAVANDSNPPSVNSISWGIDEQLVSTSELDTFNTEAQKLGLMGVTILVSSGDNGATGYGCKLGCDSASPTSTTNCVCDQSSGSSTSPWTGSNTWTGTGYVPKFPATSPYVTAVGGTAGPEIGGSEVASQSDKSNVITTGGGFSEYYAQPYWQTSAVSGYFSAVPNSPATGYNNQGRGYPDVSLIAVNYAVIVQGITFYMYGTSASTPVFAGMISLINADRQKIGLGTLGFINPTLYGNAGKFNDVTSGNNKCCSVPDATSSAYCCNAGFETAAGWDPVTGFGSISYSNLRSMF